MTYDQLATPETVEKTIAALQQNGIQASFVKNGLEAKEKVLALIPGGSEVMNMTSITLDTIGLSNEILTSGKYTAVRNKLNAMDRKTQALEMNRLGAAPQYTVGSVHAVTEDGKVLIASNTGSQLPAYVYGAQKVIWIVGTQKIVPDLDTAYQRIYDYVLPLESERAHKAYGVPASFVSKLLIVNREVQPDRITIIFVGEKLGF
jgi:hypothetical protein